MTEQPELQPAFTCHKYGATDLSETPLQIEIVQVEQDTEWKHHVWRHTTCGVIVCPSCGDPPTAPDVLCGACRTLAKKTKTV